MGLKLLSEIAGRLMRCPAAPHHEEFVRAEVEKICAENNLDFRRDGYGNVIVHLKTLANMRPLVLGAHLDHPGFEIVRALRRRKWLARFLGGVGDDYFKKGVSLRLMPGGLPAKLGKRVGS